MKTKARDGHAIIIACVTPPYIFQLWGYKLHLVPVLFSIVIPTSFNILMKFFYTCFSLQNTCSSISHASCTPFVPHCHVKSHTHNNKEMAFMYMKIHTFLALLVQERSYFESFMYRNTPTLRVLSCIETHVLYLKGL